MRKIPLQVDIIWHKDFKLGEEYAKKLFKQLDKDPDHLTQQDIGIPVKLNPSFSKIDTSLSEKIVRIFLIDSKFLGNDVFYEKLNTLSQENSEYILILFNQKVGHLPVELQSKNIFSINSEVIKETFGEENTEKFQELYFLQTVFEAVVCEIYSKKEKKEAKLFLSHTKRDGIGQKIARELRDFINDSTKSSPFFDENNIMIGEGFWEKIEAEIKGEETFLIAINSDEYSNSSWCRREILTAKKYQKPILVIDVLEEKQQRSFPYIGNTRVLTINSKNIKKLEYYKILIELYLKAIKFKVRERMLDKYKERGKSVCITTPELLTLALCDDWKNVIYYPDPPLPKEELEIFKILDKKLCTPLEDKLFQQGIKNKQVMLSLSENNDIVDLEVKSLLAEMVRYFIAFDFIVAYGGSLKYENKELNFMSQILKVLEFYKKEEQAKKNQRIANYLAYPLTVNSEMKANYRNDIRFIEINPDNLPKEDDKKYFSDNAVWEKSLLAMRERIVSESDYVIVAGGKKSGFKGRMPGILEEFIIALKNKKPIYVLGGFEGVAKEITDYLQGKDLSTELEEYKGYLEEITDEISIDNLRNGLTVEENKQLFILENHVQIMELILQGISNLNKGEC